MRSLLLSSHKCQCLLRSSEMTKAWDLVHYNTALDHQKTNTSLPKRIVCNQHKYKSRIGRILYRLRTLEAPVLKMESALPAVLTKCPWTSSQTQYNTVYIIAVFVSSSCFRPRTCSATLHLQQLFYPFYENTVPTERLQLCLPAATPETSPSQQLRWLASF